MSIPAGSFYVAGGTLRPDAPSYVPRRADEDLYAGVMAGEYCYVLHARQMGKSSLMAQTTARLRKEGVTVAAFELTALGRNLTVEQWYDGLLSRIGRELDIEDELEAYWDEHERWAPLQRFMGAIRDVVLARRASSGCGRVVLFLDEIDAVRSLPFSTDEFFAAIRECYNRRSQDPEYERLSFCLLGVASPSDLIQDTRTTPFNIGRRVELTDFTEAEAVPLAQGLGRDPETSQALLQRVLYWTGGHPYLTQRLCRAVAQDPAVTDPSGVDRHCAALFLSSQAQERDDNLLFVRERLLKAEVDRASVLDLYRQVRCGKPVRLDDTNQLVTILRLSGITRVDEGSLRVRNRIYERVFNQEWITQHMPDAELRRQRAAYRQGLIRATGIATAVVAVVAALALAAGSQARRANRQQRLAEERHQQARRSLYAAQMNLAQEACGSGNIAGAQELLDAWRPGPGQEDLRGFEWRYLWRLCLGDELFTFRGHTGRVLCVAFSPDGHTIASASEDQTVRLWDTRTRREVAAIIAHAEGVNWVAFSPDGKMMATSGGRPGFTPHEGVKLWIQQPSGWKPARLHGQKGGCHVLAFAPDSRSLAVGGPDGDVTIWDTVSRRLVRVLQRQREGLGVTALAYSADGRMLASNSGELIRLWDVPTGREVGQLKGHTGEPWSVAFSPAGGILASCSQDGSIRLWNTVTRRQIRSLRGHRGPAERLAFSPDGKILATVGTVDCTVRLWDAATGQEINTLKGHRDRVFSVEFSPDGRSLVTGSQDNTVRLWRVSTRQEAGILRSHRGRISSLAFSPDGRTLASGTSNSSISLWNVSREREFAALPGHCKGIRSLVFTRDGKGLISSGEDGSVKLWRLDAGRAATMLTRTLNIGSFHEVALSPDGRTLASGFSDTRVQLWDILTNREVGSFAIDKTLDWLNTAAFSPDGKLVAAGEGYGPQTAVRLWDLNRRRPVGDLRGHDLVIQDVAFSPDGKLLASSAWDGTIKLWDLGTMRAVATMKPYTGPIVSISFSPDGKTLASSGTDGSVTLWSVAAGQKVASLKGHTLNLGAVAFSPDGNTLASAGADETVRLWRAATIAETDAGRTSDRRP